METSRLRSVWMSRTSGMFSRITGSSVRMAAAMAGRAAFFAPLMRTLPTRGLPPRITNLSIRLSGAVAPLTKSIRTARLRVTGFFRSCPEPLDSIRLALVGWTVGGFETIFIRLPHGNRPPYITLGIFESERRLLAPHTGLQHDEC